MSNEGWNKLYHEYLLSSAWQSKRQLVIERANGMCERCQEERIVDVHHLTYDNVFDEPLEDLQGLCRKCHTKAHNQKVAAHDWKPPRIRFTCDPVFNRILLRQRDGYLG